MGNCCRHRIVKRVCYYFYTHVSFTVSLYFHSLLASPQVVLARIWNLHGLCCCHGIHEFQTSSVRYIYCRDNSVSNYLLLSWCIGTSEMAIIVVVVVGNNNNNNNNNNNHNRPRFYFSNRTCPPSLPYHVLRWIHWQCTIITHVPPPCSIFWNEFGGYQYSPSFLVDDNVGYAGS